MEVSGDLDQGSFLLSWSKHNTEAYMYGDGIEAISRPKGEVGTYWECDEGGSRISAEIIATGVTVVVPSGSYSECVLVEKHNITGGSSSPHWFEYWKPEFFLMASLSLFRYCSQALLFILPMCMLCCAAVLRIYPFARTRHSVILAPLMAAGISLGIDAGMRKWNRLTICALLLAAPIYVLSIEPDQQNIPSYRDQRKSLLAGISYRQSTLPRDGIVNTDRKTAFIMEFYLNGAHMTKNFSPGMIDTGFFQVAWKDWEFQGPSAVLNDIKEFRREHKLIADKPLWVIDGGFSINLKQSKAPLKFQDSLLIFWNAGTIERLIGLEDGEYLTSRRTDPQKYGVFDSRYRK